MSNAVLHAYVDGDTPGTIDFVARRVGDGFEVRIRRRARPQAAD